MHLNADSKVRFFSKESITIELGMGPHYSGYVIHRRSRHVYVCTLETGSIMDRVVDTAHIIDDNYTMAK